MDITGFNPISSSDTEMQVSNSAILGKDDFLTLLVTQLQYQDPLSPMESMEFTAQLAQFSSLEQLGNINDNMEYSQQYQAAINNSQAVSYIGKIVTASGNTIMVTDGAPGSIRFELEKDAKAAFIHIYNALGNLVKTIESGDLNAGEQVLFWDGTDNNGSFLPEGEYMFEVLAVDASDEMVNAETFTTGKVTGVSFENNTAYLLADSQKIPLANVLEVVEP